MRRTSPTQPSSRRKTGRRLASSSGRPAHAATSRRSSRRTRIVVASARRARFASSTTVRKRSARSCEAASRPAIPRTVSSRSASSASRARPDGAAVLVDGRRYGTSRRELGTSRSDRVDPADERPSSRRRRAVWCSGRPPTSRPGQADRDRRLGARARLDGCHRKRRQGSRHPSWSRVGPSYEGSPGDSGSVDRPSAAGLHSGGVAAPRGHDRQIPHPRSARPVDDGPSPIDGKSAVITRKPLRPAS